MKKQRKHYTPEEKVAILKRHLLDKETSKLCDELGLQPTVSTAGERVLRKRGVCLRTESTRLAQGYVEHYNNVRFNSAIGSIAPKNILAGRRPEIHAERDRKLEEARKQRQIRRQNTA